MRLSSALNVLVAILAIPACGFQAFSGSACDGDAGLDVPCDGTCYSFKNRHSFRADLSGDAHSVAMFVDAICAGQLFNFIRVTQAAECTNVNTGTDIESFQCLSGSADSASSDSPVSASAPTLSMSFSSTDSSTLYPQSNASNFSAPPASASSISLLATGSSTLLASPSTNTNDGRGARSGMSGVAIAGAAVLGSVAALLLLCGALWCYMRRSRPRRPTAPVDDPIQSAAAYSDHPPADSPFLVYRSPITAGTHRTAPAMSPISPREMSAVSPSSPRSNADLASEVALMREQLERLSRSVYHDTPPRYEDGKV